MFLLRVIEWTIAAVAVLFVVTQIVVPLLKDRLLWPILRDGAVPKLEGELRATNEDLSAAELEQEIRKRKEQASRVRSPKKGSGPASPSSNPQ